MPNIIIYPLNINELISCIYSLNFDNNCKSILCKLYFLSTLFCCCLLFFAEVIVRIVRVVSVLILIAMSILLGFDNNKKFIDVVSVNCYDFEIVDLDGDSAVVIVSLHDWDKLKNDLAVESVYVEKVAGREVIECYSSRIKGGVMINGRKVNLQVSINDDKCVIGCPLIKNSF